MSPEGERYIREYVALEPPVGMETSLTAAYRKTVRDRDGRLIERFDREHYFFGHSPPSKHTDHVRFDLFGRVVAIHRETVEKVRGKQLTVVQSDKIDGIDYTHDILVAVDSDDATQET
jgi:hypothetical protein